MSQSLAEIIQARSSSLNRPASSIELMSETKVLTNNSSIELPQKIKDLTTGPDYWKRAKTNRYLKLYRDGYGSILERLADMAPEKNNPANWFATSASKRWWQRTLDFFKKLDEVVKKAAQAAEKLGTAVTKFIYKQAWHNKYIQRWADLAAESGRSPIKYFAWLCKHGEETYGNQA